MEVRLTGDECGPVSSSSEESAVALRRFWDTGGGDGVLSCGPGLGLLRVGEWAGEEREGDWMSEWMGEETCDRIDPRVLEVEDLPASRGSLEPTRDGIGEGSVAKMGGERVGEQRGE